MGFRIRKSFKIAKGVRVNVSKTGVGLSVGTRGLRHSIHSSGRRTSTIGLPGTGISYVKTSTIGSRKRTNSNTAIQRQLQKQHDIEGNTKVVDDYNELLERVVSVHKECDETMDWVGIHALQPPYNYPDAGPHKTKAEHESNNYTPNFFAKLFKSIEEKRRTQLIAETLEAELLDAKEYEDWKNLNLLSKRIVQGDIAAYFEVINEMKPLEDLLEFGSGFEFAGDCSRAIEIDFKVKSDTVIPNYVLSLTKTGKLSRKEMTKTRYYDLIQDYVCSCAIRVAREVMALLPVEKVVVHALNDVLNTATGHNEQITILSVVFDRHGVNGLNFELIDPSDALQNFNYHMKYLKTSGFRAVERIVEY